MNQRHAMKAEERNRLLSQPWTMEYVARLFIEGGGFQGIANTHNAALERVRKTDERPADLLRGGGRHKRA